MSVCKDDLIGLLTRATLGIVQILLFFAFFHVLEETGVCGSIA